MINPAAYEILEREGVQGLYTFKDPSYEMQFRITEFCNYECHYCHWHFGKHYTFEDIKRTATTALNLISCDNCRVYFHGGEPTMHPKLIDILTHLFNIDKNIIVELQTNLSAKKSLFKKMMQTFADDKLEINVSYHPTQVKCFDEFVDKLDMLHDDSSLGKVDVMLDHDDKLRDMIIQNCDLLLDRAYGDRIEFIHGYINYDNSSELYTDYVKDNSKFNMRYKVVDEDSNTTIYDTNDLYNQGINFKGWKCAVGKKYIIVNGNGDYYMCCANMFDKPAGNLLDNPQMFKLRTSHYTICKWCSCKGEFYIEKFK